MPRYLACYDIKDTTPDPHSTLLALAREHNWNEYIRVDTGHWNRLPNTTLQGVFPTKEAASVAFRKLVLATGRKIKVKVVVEKVAIMRTTGEGFVKSDKKLSRAEQILRNLR